MKRILALILAILMIVPLASCKKKGDDTKTTDTQTVDTTPVDPESLIDYSYTKPSKNYSENGQPKEVNILVRTQSLGFHDSQTSSDSTKVDMATFASNTAVGEAFGVELVYSHLNGYSSGQAEFCTAIRNANNAGDDCFDIISPAMFGNDLIIEQQWADLQVAEYLNTEKGWWSSAYIDSVRLNDKLYTITGDLSVDLLRCMTCVYVYGGSYKNFNPANNVSEGANTNFVALGYASVSNGEWYEVKQAPIVVKNGEVDYNGATLTVGAAPANTASTYGILCPEGTVTVKNLTIDGGDYRTTNDKGLRGIYITKAGNYTFENVVVKNVLYAINVNSTKSVVLNVVNSTLEGWTSYGNTTDATFTNVNFTCGKYANFKPYTNTTLTGCAFEGGFTIDLTEVAEGEVITFVNCTYGGVALTAENFNAVAKVDGYAAEKVAF